MKIGKIDLLILSALLFTVGCFAVYQEMVLKPAVFWKGSGTENDPFVIETPEQFLLIQHYPKSYFILANDLDFSSIPIESEHLIMNFGGTIDGKGHKISNLRGTRLSTIFKCSYYSPKLYNLGFENLILHGGQNPACIVSASEVIFENVYVKNSTVNGSLAVVFSAYAHTTLKNCYAEGVSVSGNWAIGMCIVATHMIRIENCYFIGEINGQSMSKTVHYETSPYRQPIIINFYYHTPSVVEGEGTWKTLEEMKRIETFNFPIKKFEEFDNSTPWFIRDGEDFPRLWFEHPMNQPPEPEPPIPPTEPPTPPPESPPSQSPTFIETRTLLMILIIIAVLLILWGISLEKLKSKGWKR